MTSITPTPQVQTERDSGRAPRRGWLIAVFAAVLLVAVGLLLWLMPVSKASQSEVFQDVDGLVIEVTGGVSLQGGDQTELIITKEWLLAGEPSVVATQDDGVARVTGECSWWQIRCTTSVSGTVAADAEVEVTASAGSIEVSGTTSGVDLQTSAGSVRADDIVGRAQLKTSAGNIDGSITDGDVEAEASAGHIHLTVLGDFSSLSASTSAGDVDLTVTDEVYDVVADTSAGTVGIEVRTDSSAPRRISAETSAGSITIRPESG